MKNTRQQLLATLFGLCMSASVFAQQCGGSSSTSSGSSGGGVNCVPEPSSLPLVLLGLVGAVVVGRFLKKK